MSCAAKELWKQAQRGTRLKNLIVDCPLCGDRIGVVVNTKNNSVTIGPIGGSSQCRTDMQPGKELHIIFSNTPLGENEEEFLP